MSDIWKGAWRLDSVDPATGRMLWICHDEGKIHWRVTMNVDAVIEANQQARAESDGKRHGEWSRIASIPLPLFYSSGYADASLQGDEKWIKRFLNDIDNRAWRTKDSKV